MKLNILFVLLLFPLIVFSQEITPIDLTPPSDTPREAFQKINTNEANIKARLDSVVLAIDGIEVGETVYSGQSPTTTAIGGLPAWSDISGQSLADIIESIVAPYVNPVFTSFSVSGQSTTVEVGTTLSGSKTFTWNITANSGTVSTIDIYDVTAASTLLAGTANDGTQAQTITTNQLNSNGATQVWRGIGNNSSPSGTFNSGNFTVTARYYRFYGPVETIPSSSSGVRALTSAFQTGTGTFDMETGSEESTFVVYLPPGFVLSSAVDLDALSAPISFSSLGTEGVNDAGSTERNYNGYAVENAVPYDVSHTWRITVTAE